MRPFKPWHAKWSRPLRVLGEVWLCWEMLLMLIVKITKSTIMIVTPVAVVAAAAAVVAFVVLFAAVVLDGVAAQGFS